MMHLSYYGGSSGGALDLLIREVAHGAVFKKKQEQAILSLRINLIQLSWSLRARRELQSLFKHLKEIIQAVYLCPKSLTQDLFRFPVTV
jgi:hypothetical protein